MFAEAQNFGVLQLLWRGKEYGMPHQSWYSILVSWRTVPLEKEMVMRLFYGFHF
jgi:hypothetical protein